MTDLFKKFKSALHDQQNKETKSDYDEEQMHTEIEEFSALMKDFVHNQTMGGDSEAKDKIDELRKDLQDKWDLNCINIEISVTVSVEKSHSRTEITEAIVPQTIKEHEKIFEKAKTKLANSLSRALKLKNENRKPN